MFRSRYDHQTGKEALVAFREAECDRWRKRFREPELRATPDQIWVRLSPYIRTVQAKAMCFGVWQAASAVYRIKSSLSGH